MGDGWARGDDGANGSKDTIGHAGSASANTAAQWRTRYVQGVMGADVSCRIDDIKDGTSNTIMIGELRAGVVACDCRGTWAMSGACPSSLWGHGYISDDNGPNCPSIESDDNMAGDAVHAAVGDPPLGSLLVKMGMPCYSSDTAPNDQQTARSMHPGGVTVGMCDGSVRFISDYIQLGNPSNIPTTLGVWDKLNLSNDGLPDRREPVLIRWRRRALPARHFPLAMLDRNCTPAAAAGFVALYLFISAGCSTNAR